MQSLAILRNILIVALAVLSGFLESSCAPELSKTPGISIKRTYHKHFAIGGDSQGRHRIEGFSVLNVVSGQYQVYPYEDRRVIYTIDDFRRYDIIYHERSDDVTCHELHDEPHDWEHELYDEKNETFWVLEAVCEA